MKKSRTSLTGTILTAALLMVTGCVYDDFQGSTGGKGQTPITLTASAGMPVTRAGAAVQSECFDGGEKINAYIWDSDDNQIGWPTVLTTVAAAENSTNALTPGTQPYFPADGSKKISLYALYPSTVTNSSTGFTVASNQTAVNGDATSAVDATKSYKGSDLMWASATNQGKTSDAIPLTFTHKMAKLIVNAQFDGSITGETISGITVKGVNRTIGFTPSTGVLGALSNSGDITMTNQGACLFPPQPKSGDFVEVATSAGTATFELSESKAFDGGAVYTMNLFISAMNLNQTATITGWDDNNSTLVVNPMGDNNFAISAIYDQTYTGSAIEPTFTVEVHGKIIASSKYNVFWYNNINAGTGRVAVIGVDEYAGYCAAQSFTINKATPVVTAPTAKTSLTYNTAAQTLVNAGSTTGGELQYSMDNSTWSATAPTGTNAGSYTVYYRVVGDDNYNDVASATMGSVSIAKAAGSITFASDSPIQTWSATSSNNTYTQNVNHTGEGTVAYSISNNTCGASLSSTSSSTVTFAKAGSVTITATVSGDTNYSYASTTVSHTLTVNRATGYVTLSASSGIVTAGGSISFTISSNHGGTLSASTNNTSRSTATLSSSTVTITTSGKDESEATITVTCGQTDTYTSATATYALTINSTEPGVALSKATVGMIVLSDGKAYTTTTYDAKFGTKVAVVGYVDGSHGYAIALENSTSKTWNNITNNASNKNTDCTLNTSWLGSVPSAPTGTTWKVLTREHYTAIWTAMGSTTGDAYGLVADANVNKVITDWGGSALSGLYWCTSEFGSGAGFCFNQITYGSNGTYQTCNIRPSLVW